MEKEKHRKIASAIKTAVGDFEENAEGMIKVEKTPMKEVGIDVGPKNAETSEESKEAKEKKEQLKEEEVKKVIKNQCF